MTSLLVLADGHVLDKDDDTLIGRVTCNDERFKAYRVTGAYLGSFDRIDEATTALAENKSRQFELQL